jgi:hypothetical protein
MPRTRNVDLKDMIDQGVEISSVDHFIRVLRPGEQGEEDVVQPARRARVRRQAER